MMRVVCQMPIYITELAVLRWRLDLYPAFRRWHGLFLHAYLCFLLMTHATHSQIENNSLNLEIIISNSPK
jgi:hypothetical protein